MTTIEIEIDEDEQAGEHGDGPGHGDVPGQRSRSGNGPDRGPWTVLRIRGELDLVTSPLIRRRVHEAVARGRHDLVIDLSGVRFCDSSGVGVLIAARRLLRSCGGKLRLILPEEGDSHVGRVLAALGVRRLFDVYDDVPEALTGAARTAP